MPGILVPVDRSANALRAVEFVIRLAAVFRSPPQIHLLNVQPSFPGTIRGVAQLALEEHQREGLAALAEARNRLEVAGIPYAHHVAVGETAETIARYVTDHGIGQVVMGRSGMGSLSSLLLGSVANKLLHLAHVPVLLVP